LAVLFFRRSSLRRTPPLVLTRVISEELSAGVAGMRSTHEQPDVTPEWIDSILVNGPVVVDHGKHTDARPGKAIDGPSFRQQGAYESSEIDDAANDPTASAGNAGEFFDAHLRGRGACGSGAVYSIVLGVAVGGRTSAREGRGREIVARPPSHDGSPGCGKDRCVSVRRTNGDFERE
jgi:hypothetical protein